MNQWLVSKAIQSASNSQLSFCKFLAHQQKLWSSLTFKRRNNGIGKEIIGGRESRRRELAC